MLRRVIAGLVLVGMAIGVWVLWPEEEDPASSTTTTVASAASAPVATPAPATSAPDVSTSTKVIDDHVVETIEEAEAILRELWLGWFEGIYNQDEDRIREVVATEEQIQAAVDQFREMTFYSEPSRDQVRLENTEILRSDPVCLAVYSNLDFASITGANTEGVHVFLRESGDWFFVSFWLHKDDLWERDCDARLS